jgi:hypothetical protein
MFGDSTDLHKDAFGGRYVQERNSIGARKGGG